MLRLSLIQCFLLPKLMTGENTVLPLTKSLGQYCHPVCCSRIQTIEQSQECPICTCEWGPTNHILIWSLQTENLSTTSVETSINFVGFSLEKVHLPSWTNSRLSYSGYVKTPKPVTPLVKGGAHQKTISHLHSFFWKVTSTMHTWLQDHFIAFVLSLCSAKSTNPAANPPRGESYPIAVW